MGDQQEKTLNRIFCEGGFEVCTVIPNDQLPERLTGTLVDIARGKYTDVRVIPDDLALKGSEWQLDRPSHVVYVKRNPEHPGYDPGSRYLVMPLFRHVQTGEMNNVLPIAHL